MCNIKPSSSSIKCYAELLLHGNNNNQSGFKLV